MAHWWRYHALLVRVIDIADAFTSINADAAAAAAAAGSSGFARKSNTVHCQQARIDRVPELRKRAQTRAQMVEVERFCLNEPHTHPRIRYPNDPVGAALAEYAHVPSKAEDSGGAARAGGRRTCHPSCRRRP